MTRKKIKHMKLLTSRLLVSVFVLMLVGCHLDGILCCDESGLSSGIQQIANGVIDIIDYFD